MEVTCADDNQYARTWYPQRGPDLGLVTRDGLARDVILTTIRAGGDTPPEHLVRFAFAVADEFMRRRDAANAANAAD